MADYGRRKFIGGIMASAAFGTGVQKLAATHTKSFAIGNNGTSAIVLGSAQDAGIPHVACYKTHCQAARNNPALGRRASCLAILDSQTNSSFMFDATPDFPEQLADIPQMFQKKRKPLDGIFLTHAHLGHYTGLMYLGRAAMNADAVPVYCSKLMSEFIKKNGPWSLLVELNNIELRIVEPGKEYKVSSNLAVTPFKVDHRAEFTDTLAFIARGPAKSILYLPDIDRWQGLNPTVSELVQQVDYALLDATFYSGEELPGRDMSKIPHPPVVDSMKLFEKLDLQQRKKIYFTHLNHSNLLLDADGNKLRDLRNRGFNITEELMDFAL